MASLEDRILNPQSVQSSAFISHGSKVSSYFKINSFPMDLQCNRLVSWKISTLKGAMSAGEHAL